MKMKILLIELLLIMGACNQNNTYIIDKNKLLGEWTLSKNEINYPSLTFNADSIAVFTSMADTIYRFKYSIKNNLIILKDIYNVERINKVKMLNHHELIFYNLLTQNTEQIYRRKTPL
jgi:hypothetical protein